MLRIKGSFLGGDAIDGAAAYKLSEHVGDDIIKYSFANDGYIDNEGQVVSKDEKHHTDIIPIASLVNNNGYCVGVFDTYYTEYPKVVFFSGNTLDTFIRGFSISEISHKEKLTAEEVKYLASKVDGATHVAFNSDYEAGGIESDYVYVLNDKSHSEIDTKQIIQGFDNHGSISTFTGDEMFENNYEKIKLGEEKVVIPITKFQVDGRVYYFKFSVPLKVETNEGIISQTVEGYLYVDEPTLGLPLRAIGFEYQDSYEIGSVEKYKSIALETNYGSVTLAKLDEKYLYGNISIDSDDGAFTVYCSDDWMRTDFIPVESLTDDLTVTIDGEEKKYCVGCFDTSHISGVAPYTAQIAFFSDMDYSTIVYAPNGLLEKPYFTADEIRAMPNQDGIVRAANYVIFASENSNKGELTKNIFFKNEGIINSNGEIVPMADAHHTDIIAINDLRNYEGYYFGHYNGYCAGTFDINFDQPQVLFFSGDNLDSFIQGFNILRDLGAKKALKVEDIKKLAENAPGATHVAFNSNKEGAPVVVNIPDHVIVYAGEYNYDKDYVSVGGICFHLNKYDELDDNKTHYLAVKALTSGEEELQLDSDYSDDIEFLYFHPTCKINIDNTSTEFSLNITYRAYENGEVIDKTVVLPENNEVTFYAATGTEIFFDHYISDFGGYDVTNDKTFEPEYRYEGDKTYVTVPNLRHCALTVL